MNRTLKKGILALIIGIALVFSFTACDNGTGTETASGPQSATYVSHDSAGNFYMLVITENTNRSARYTARNGDSFTFTVELYREGAYSVALTYSGIIESAQGNGTTIAINITVNDKPLVITVNGTNMTVISGEIVLDILDEDGEKITITLDDGESLTPQNTPEEWPVAKRWGKWIAEDSTATVDYSVGDDGVCTITVGGTAMTALPAWENVWKVNASYSYTAEKGKIYAYSFEAWTDSAARTMNVQWYGDNDNAIYHNTGYNENQLPVFTITSQRQTYTITGSEPIPKSGIQTLEFQCANQTGTYYVKILSITQTSGGGDDKPLVPPGPDIPGEGGILTSISDLRKYLGRQPANTPATSYTIKLNVSDLGDSSINESVGYVLGQENYNKYVNLDLSGSTITTIGDNAFGYCSLTGITIPDSVISIGSNAFRDCTNLASVTIPNSVTWIGDNTFYGCTSLTSVTIGNGVTSIGGHAFEGCDSLASITIPNGVTSIEEYAFFDCTSLTSVTIPNSVTSIGRGAFFECTSLTSVTLPTNANFTNIGNSVFFRCSSLASITIPNSVTSIGGWAFYGCTKLVSVTFEGTIASNEFGDSVFGRRGVDDSYIGDLLEVYLADDGGPGIYTRPDDSSETWTKQ